MTDHRTQATPGVQMAGRALAVVSRSAETDRRSAGFLTQLLACERRFMAYREARRAEPARAGAAYGATVAVGRGTFDLSV